MKLRSRLVLLLALAGLWVALSACSCGDVVDQVLGGGAEVATRGAEEPTLFPTGTPSPMPTLPGPAVRTTASPGPLAVLRTPNAEFTLEITEEEFAEYFAQQELGGGGFEVSDFDVEITAEVVVASFLAAQEETGINGRVILTGVPVVVDGELFFRVNQVELGDEFSGFTRLLAQAAIERVIDQYSTENGIPIPLVERAEFKDVRLEPGRMILTGRTR